MYYVYVLKNQAGNHYVGYTSNLLRRIKDHNSGKSRRTKRKGPWRLVHREEFPTTREAQKRERQIKRYKGGEAFQRLLAGPLTE
jgi:putative endonuclease